MDGWTVNGHMRVRSVYILYGSTCFCIKCCSIAILLRSSVRESVAWEGATTTAARRRHRRLKPEAVGQLPLGFVRRPSPPPPRGTARAFEDANLLTVAVKAIKIFWAMELILSSSFCVSLLHSLLFSLSHSPLSFPSPPAMSSTNSFGVWTLDNET